MPKNQSSGKKVRVLPMTQAELRYEAEQGAMEIEAETIEASAFLGSPGSLRKDSSEEST